MGLPLEKLLHIIFRALLLHYPGEFTSAKFWERNLKFIFFSCDTHFPKSNGSNNSFFDIAFLILIIKKSNNFKCSFSIKLPVESDISVSHVPEKHPNPNGQGDKHPVEYFQINIYFMGLIPKQKAWYNLRRKKPILPLFAVRRITPSLSTPNWALCRGIRPFQKKKARITRIIFF
jgi:hypothetical protein